MSAKELTALIQDEERLRAERSDRRSWKSRVTGIDEYPSGLPGGAGGDRDRPRRDRPVRAQRRDEDDLEYRLAIEASKNEAEEEAKRRAGSRVGGGGGEDDEDLAKAIKLSKEEEDLRRRQLEDQNAQSLFDDTPAQAPQPTGFNQGYQQQGAVDWFGNLLDQQQPQQTGFGGVPGQQPGYQNGGYGQFQQQPQQTGFDAFGQQQQQQQFMQPQQTAFQTNNPYSQQQQTGFGQNGFGQQQQEEQSPAPGSMNPWATGLPQSANMVKPQPTGSNNPFAQSFNRPQSATTHRPPTLATLSEQQATTTFSNPSAGSLFSTQPQQPQQPQHQSPVFPEDPHKSRLNALLASGEGQDTFGNVGDLRIPAQHTAPGTFVNSAGAGANRLTANATGNNPFLNSQFTGMPQTNRVMPAQTGPAGAYGGFGGGGFGGSTNPFGAGQRQQQHGNSLIDL